MSIHIFGANGQFSYMMKEDEENRKFYAFVTNFWLALGPVLEYAPMEKHTARRPNGARPSK